MIRNIWAVGRNYADHAKELGNAIPESPLIFLKAGSTAVFDQTVKLPDWSVDVHHEIELALQFDSSLNVCAFGLALDLTERHFQNQLKAKGQPWTLAKSFTASCPLSSFLPVQNLDELANLDISLKRNGKVVQSGNTSQMIFKIPELIAFVKAHFPVCEHDVLLTGTPAGVGKIDRQDLLEGNLSGAKSLQASWSIR